MQKKDVIIALAITILTFSGCAIGKRSVYFDEMLHKPVLTINQDTLIVKLSGTMHSGLCTYKTNISVDNMQKTIYLSARHALCRSKPRGLLELLIYPFSRPFRNPFQIKLSKYKVSDPNLFDFYWRDPDKKITKLEITY